ncbi:MAG: hypothetical protein ACR2M1_04465 [Gemmatimonadaceae bacterium]
MDLWKVRGDRARLGIGIEPINEARLDPGAEIHEGERVHWRIESGRQTRRVPVRLQLDVDEGISRGLGLERADRLAANKEQVVGEAVARGHPELAHGDARAGREIHLRAVLDDPTRRMERGVNLLACLLFRCRAHAGPRSARKYRRCGSQ